MQRFFSHNEHVESVCSYSVVIFKRSSLALPDSVFVLTVNAHPILNIGFIPPGGEMRCD